MLTPLSTLVMWSGRVEKEWNLDQCLSHPGTSFYCHVFLVEPLKALSLFLPQRPNKVPSLSLCEVSEVLHTECGMQETCDV